MNFKEKLFEFNKRGLIHAPYEPDESFFQRCRQATSSPTSPCSELAKKMYDIEPDWVWMVFDNKGLRLWEGACTWKQQDLITLQLNRAFQKKRDISVIPMRRLLPMSSSMWCVVHLKSRFLKRF